MTLVQVVVSRPSGLIGLAIEPLTRGGKLAGLVAGEGFSIPTKTLLFTIEGEPLELAAGRNRIIELVGAALQEKLALRPDGWTTNSVTVYDRAEGARALARLVALHKENMGPRRAPDRDTLD